MCGFSVAGSEPAIAAARAATTALAFRRARPAAELNAVIREAAWRRRPSGQTRRPSWIKARGRPFPWVIELQSGSNRRASLQTQNYNAGNRCRSMDIG
jgi:hypothetical protein